MRIILGKPLGVRRRLFRLVLALGPIWAIRHLLQRVWLRWSKSKTTYRLRSQAARYPLLCRPDSSDHDVFHQIFVLQEYAILNQTRFLDDKSSVILVIDCGANVGYSSSYFLSNFPACRLIAVEPDRQNFAILQRNLAPFGTRARALNSAIWSHPARLRMSENGNGDHEEWSRQVEECHVDEPASFLATDIPTLLKESGLGRVSILKVDIEGAEAVVFGASNIDWIESVDIILIELHEDTPYGDPTEIFRRACGDRFDFLRSGELTVAVRREGANFPSKKDAQQ
ncbi:MAG: FkbM family methyltransferase [Chthoniobacterales bacterium]